MISSSQNIEAAQSSRRRLLGTRKLISNARVSAIETREPEPACRSREDRIECWVAERLAVRPLA